MELTIWNVRGVGSRRKQRNLSNIMKEEKLDMVSFRRQNVRWIK